MVDIEKIKDAVHHITIMVSALLVTCLSFLAIIFLFTGLWQWMMACILIIAMIFLTILILFGRR